MRLMRIGARTLSLERYSIDGVVWGRETLWLDAAGGIVAAITRAGGLSFEGVREDLESELGEFVQRSIRDRHRRPRRDHAAGCRRCARGTFALVGATVVDATGRPPITNAAILIRDGRIADVGPRASVAVPAGTPVVDYGRQDDRSWPVGHAHARHADRVGAGVSGAGVTTVRDMGNEFEFITALRDAIASRRALGPRMLAAGLVDGGGPNAFGVVYAATPEEAKAGRREIPRRRLSADQDLQPGDAADGRGDLRRRRTAWA